MTCPCDPDDEDDLSIYVSMVWHIVYVNTDGCVRHDAGAVGKTVHMGAFRVAFRVCGCAISRAAQFRANTSLLHVVVPGCLVLLVCVPVLGFMLGKSVCVVVDFLIKQLLRHNDIFSQM